MNALIKNVKFATGKKETLIKNSITSQLSNTIKEIQLYSLGDSVSTDLLQINEAENTLCTIIEAMLLHGLKDSLVYRARRIIADLDKRPEPSFWAPLLVISHRQIIEQITKLSQITTEIGQCRAWIRITLNECLLSSYLSTMRQDNSVLKPYYNSNAYIRDVELLDVAQRLIEGMEALTEFSLPCNSSLLNTWQLQSLVLAGIWSPTLRSCPIVAGVDIAQSLHSTSTTDSETASVNSATSTSLNASGIVGTALPLNEDEVLKIIFAKHSYDNTPSQSPILKTLTQEKIPTQSNPETDIATTEESASVILQPESNLGNSLNCRSSWSFFQAQEQNENVEKVFPSNTVTSSFISEGSKSMETSYNALIENYNLLGGTYIKTPDLREVWQHLEGKNNTDQVNNDQVENRTNNFEIQETPLNVNINPEAPLPLITYIGRIATTKGLDFQYYKCEACKEPLGLAQKPKMCGFTAEFFCDSCISSELIQLPARIIHNWDFKMYEVSWKAYNYIKEIKDQPTIDLKIINPYIYTVSAEMSRLQTLRIQLNFLRDYLYTCREPVIEQLQSQMNKKEYMYEHVHQYSISDLSQIQNGVLIQHLQTVVNFGIEHVQNCWLCGQKGFICEICNKSKVLYPFDVMNVYRCHTCNAVYHNGCLNSTRPCPKCERKRKREDLPLLGAIM